MIDCVAVAEQLYHARANARLCAPLDVDAIGDIATAYRIMAAFSSRIGAGRAGIKVGLTDSVAWPNFSAKAPFYAYIEKPYCYDCGAVVPSAPGLFAIESEYGFILRRDLPFHKAPFDRAMVAEAVGQVFPAIELVGLRQDIAVPDHVFSMIADNGANHAVICGEAQDFVLDYDFTGVMIRLFLDGEEVVSGNGLKVYGHPLNSLCWAANRLCENGFGLHAGNFVITGSCTGITKLGKAESFSADFGKLGMVSGSIA